VGRVTNKGKRRADSTSVSSRKQSHYYVHLFWPRFRGREKCPTTRFFSIWPIMLTTGSAKRPSRWHVILELLVRFRCLGFILKVKKIGSCKERCVKAVLCSIAKAHVLLRETYPFFSLLVSVYPSQGICDASRACLLR